MAENDDLLVRIGLTEKQYLASLARLEAQSHRSAKGVENRFRKSNRSVEKGLQQAARSGNQFSSSMRMASMQLSQVAQQGAVTGNYLQALAIQAPDLALGFGAVGIAAGALVPIIYGVAAAALSAEEDIKEIDLQGAYNSATSALEEAREAQDRYTAAIRLTGRAQSLVTPEVLQNLKLEAEAREALAFLEMAELERQRRAAEAALAESRGKLQNIVARSNDLAGIARDDTGGFARSREASEALALTQELVQQDKELLAIIREQEAELKLINSLLAQNNGEASEMIDALVESATNAEGVAVAIGSTDFGTALAGAQALSRELGISLHQAMQIKGLVGGAAREDPAILDPRDPRYDPEAARLERIREAMKNLPTYVPPTPTPTPTAGGGRGGSGGGPTRDQQEVANWIERTRSAQEALNEEFKRLEELKPLFEAENPEAYARAVAQVNENFMRSQYSEVYQGINNIADAIFDIVENSEDAGEAFARLIGRMLLESARLQAATFVQDSFTALGPDNPLTSVIGALFGSSVPSYNGGGYTGSGVRAGGLDGEGGRLAVVHPREFISDTTKGQGAAVNLTVINAPPGGEVRQNGMDVELIFPKAMDQYLASGRGDKTLNRRFGLAAIPGR